MSTEMQAAPLPAAPDPEAPLPSRAGPARNWWAAAHHTLTVTGLCAICALALLFFKPHLSDHVKELSPFFTEEMLAESEADAEDLLEVASEPASTPAVAPPTSSASSYAVAHSSASAPPRMLPLLAAGSQKSPKISPEQQRVARWLAKRYRVAGDATQMMVSSTYTIADEIKIDPLLVLAVMAIESRFNPFAESPVGAQGLMQVMSKIHHQKFEELGGVKAALNPHANIRVGALILKEYVRRGGSVEAGLKRYVGAAAFDSDFGYGHKVLAEYRRLQDVAGGKKVSVYAAAAKPSRQVVAQAPAKAAADDAAEASQKDEALMTASNDVPA